MTVSPLMMSIYTFTSLPVVPLLPWLHLLLVGSRGRKQYKFLYCFAALNLPTLNCIMEINGTKLNNSQIMSDKWKLLMGMWLLTHLSFKYLQLLPTGCLIDRTSESGFCYYGFCFKNLHATYDRVLQNKVAAFIETRVNFGCEREDLKGATQSDTPNKKDFLRLQQFGSLVLFGRLLSLADCKQPWSTQRY